MPSDGKRPVVFKQTKIEDGNTPVWHIRFTSEAFESYRDYLQRLDYYRQKIFICNITGAKDLTFEEALLSEQQASKRNEELFPRCFFAPVLAAVHHKSGKTEDLVTQAMNAIQSGVVVGEIISCRSKFGIVQQVLPGATEKEKKLKGAFFPSLEEAIKWRQAQGLAGAHAEASTPDIKTTPDSLEVLSTEAIHRTDLMPLRRDTVKTILKEHTTRDTYPKAPLIVNPDLRKEYGLAEELPAEMAETAAKFSKKRKRETDAAEAKEAKQKAKTKKQDKDTSASEPPAKRPKPEGPKFPIDDLAIERPAGAPSAPLVRTDFEVDQQHLGLLHSVWTFLVSFGRVLALSPFSCEEFAASLEEEQPNTLIAETHASLLSLIVKDKERTNVKRALISAKDWPKALLQLLHEDRDDFQHAALFNKLKRHGYSNLALQQRLVILDYLVERSVDTEAIRDALEVRSEKAHTLTRDFKEEKQEIHKRYRQKIEELDAAKKAAAEEAKAPTPKTKKQLAVAAVHKSELPTKAALHKEMEESIAELTERHEAKLSALPLRAEPLGRDRYNNRYWWFGGLVPRSTLAESREMFFITPTESHVWVEFARGNVQMTEEFADYASDAEEEFSDLPSESDSQIESESSYESSESESSEESSEESESGSGDEQSVGGSDDDASSDDNEPDYDEASRSNQSDSGEDGDGEALDIDGSEADSDENDDAPDEASGSDDESDEDFGRSGRRVKRPAPARRSTHYEPRRNSPRRNLPRVNYDELSKHAAPRSRGATGMRSSTRLATIASLEDSEERKPPRGGKATPFELLAARSHARKAKQQASRKSSSKDSRKEEKLRRKKEQEERKERKREAKEARRNARQERKEAKRKLKAEKSAKKQEQDDMQLDPQPTKGEAASANGDVSASQQAKKPRYRPGCPQPDTDQLMPTKVAHLWGCYETKEELESLLSWLDERGIRELKLKTNLRKQMPRITATMHKRVQQLKQPFNSSFRRATSSGQDPSEASQYTNKYKRKK